MNPDDLARWVNTLAECDAGIHWDPELAGLISNAPPGLLGKTATEYGRRKSEMDRDGVVRRRRVRAWSVGRVMLHAVIPLAWLDVSEGRPVSWELGQVLAQASAYPLAEEARDELDHLLACLWDILLEPLVGMRASGDEATSWRALQLDALASIGLSG
jgi:hypothetical protein